MTTQFPIGHTTPQALVPSPPTARAGTPAAMKATINGRRLALAILLCVTAVGSAAAQSFNEDIWMRAGTQASRARFDNEVLQARTDGTIKRWAPTLVEVPLRSGRSRLHALRAYPIDADSSIRPTVTNEPTNVVRESRDTTLVAGE